MGIVNATPDSFSDGGDLLDPAVGVAAALRMLEEGAGIVDIGGESTRPGATPVTPSEEIARIGPIVERIRAGRPEAVISVDTRNAATAAEAARLGADLVNDVTGATHDEAILAIAARAGLSVVLGHIQGIPATMQDDPTYRDVVREVASFLAARAHLAREAGVDRERIFVDPGIGFGKTLHHNLALLRDLPELTGIGAGIVVGCSRKRFIGELTGRREPKDRLGGSVGAALAAARLGAAIVRVHDVAATVDALRVAAAIEWNRS
jgi:dihydropteroate synthase